MKKKLTRKRIFFIELIIVVVLILTVLGVWVYRNYFNEQYVTFDNQTIRDVSFIEAKITHHRRKYELSVKMLNNTEQIIEMNKLIIRLFTEDMEDPISSIEVSFKQEIDGEVTRLKLVKGQEYRISGIVVAEAMLADRIEYEFE